MGDRQLLISLLQTS